jgi:tetratricopeptide (TPR) repeat protein
MTEKRDLQAYKSVVLENDFIRFSVLPEIGGRIFTAVDKSNGYDFFYRQNVIKPALIGMLGAWISGGVEWNIPHHHRATSFMPVDYTLEEAEDGSKTVWVGETELRHRMKWLVGMTLRPDRSYIEMTVKVFNRTPAAQSFLFWINPAVHANTNYQVLFPPSVEWAVQHAKPEFASWPIAKQVYGANDYTRGVDISWWRNHSSPVSFFAWDCREDFFGGYDHGRQAGVAQISNHYVSPGKKFFEWGTGPEGEMWTRILTDEDGPYLELMAGSYSDNQPDYSWVQPHEVKVFKHYWYPIRQLGGLANANTEAAVNLTISNQVARVAFNTTGSHHKALAALISGTQPLLQKTIDISPSTPFVTEVELPAVSKPESLRAMLRTSDGVELISYQPKTPKGTEMPKPVQRPIAPHDIKSVEELYLTGLRIEQLYSPSFEPEPYYLEALRRDAGDYRANTALGSYYCRQGRFEEAEPLLRKAADRATANYIRSRDTEASYYLGVALRALDRPVEARAAFYAAIWNVPWKAAGYCALAELACAATNFDESLELAEKSLEAGTLNTKALELKASLLRKLKQPRAAETVTARILELDPLNGRARYERVLLGVGGRKAAREFSDSLRGEVSSYLELATDYANAGLWPEAAAVLDTFLRESANPDRVNPLVHYYSAYYESRLGNKEDSDRHLLKAAEMPADFCFPFQYEAEKILRFAMKRNTRDARAPYYLGNLLFDTQPTNAIAAWQKAVEFDGKFAMAQRNLGLARAQTEKNVAEAIPLLEKAIELEPKNARFYYELDILHEAAGTPLDKRLAVLNKNPDIVARRDDSVTRRIQLLIAAGDTDTALEILQNRHFRNWEGSSGLHDVYVDACLRSGNKQLKADHAEGALRDFQAALDYPLNQEVGRARRGLRLATIYYHIGLAQLALGNAAEAEASLQKAAQAREGNASESAYYKALALQKTGKVEDATKLLTELSIRSLADLKGEQETVDYFAKFGERRAPRIRQAEAHYLAGLGLLGTGQKEQASEHFSEALALHPAHLGAICQTLQ